MIAPLTEDTVSRHHLSLEPLAEGRFRIRNGSKAIPIRLTTGRGGQAGRDPGPADPLAHHARPQDDPGGHARDASRRAQFQELPEATLPPGAFDGLATRMGGIGAGAFPSNDPAGMVRWLRVAMEVLQAAATSSDFFEKAAQAAADLVGLDSASVWLLRDDEWVQQAYTSNARLGQPAKAPASRHVLNKVRQRAKTLWDKPEGSATATDQPRLDRRGRRRARSSTARARSSAPSTATARSSARSSRQRGEITEVQAMLVELLASGIAAGLERLRHEQAAVAARVQFEQFFTHDLALQLEKNPDLLKGRESEVTLLFCDIRGFSRISEKLGPAKTVEWINDVMGVLSDSVLAHQGVLVDYIGDELMAMWGAPTEQPDHAAAGLPGRARHDRPAPRAEPQVGADPRRAARPRASASTPAWPRSATPGRSGSSSTARSAPRSTWPAGSRGRPSTSRPAC